MKKSKGFTLIELLAVVVILGILITFSTVAISKIKKNQDKKNYENVISSILTGAKAYNAEERIKLGDAEEDSGVDIYTLKDSGYIDFDETVFKDISDVGDIKVYKIACPSPNIKLEYKIEIDGITYTDCGCELQEAGPSEDLCIEE